jgi:hypothetical protein
MITLNKESDTTWCVFNSGNGKSADIVRINEYNGLKPKKSRYRVDVKGATEATMIEHFQTAKGIAVGKVK